MEIRLPGWLWGWSIRCRGGSNVSYPLKVLELLMKYLGLAAPEQHQHVHRHVHCTPEQLNRMTDEQLDRTEAAYTVIAALEQEVASDDAQRARFGARAADSTS